MQEVSPRPQGREQSLVRRLVALLSHRAPRERYDIASRGGNDLDYFVVRWLHMPFFRRMIEAAAVDVVAPAHCRGASPSVLGHHTEIADLVFLILRVPVSSVEIGDM